MHWIQQQYVTLVCDDGINTPWRGMRWILQHYVTLVCDVGINTPWLGMRWIRQLADQSIGGG